MKRKTVSGIMLSLLLIGMLALAFNIQPVESDWAWTETIYIKADGSVDPDTAPISSVDSITYILTDSIVGYVPEDTSAIVVERDNIVVDGAGYTLQGTGASLSKGISLSGRSNVTIKNMEIEAFYYGVYLNYSSNNSIFNNTLSKCSYAIDGLYPSGNNHNIFNNFISDNTFGICLDMSSGSVISNNTILNSQRLGIYLLFCSNIILTNNNMTGNVYSLAVSGTPLSNFIHDIDVSNTVNGKPVYYLINQRNLIIDPLTFPDIGYLGLVNSTNVIIKNLNLTRSGQGLLLAYTTRSTVMHLNISFNSKGIDIFSSSNNTITDNKITSNRYSGIELSVCESNTISNNTISNNGQAAISMGLSDRNIIKCNTLSNNNYGIGLYSSQDNTVHHNSFIDNGEQVFGYQSINTWDNGYPSGGNYWSDYVCTGNPSDGSQPYIIDADNIDHYPFQDPNGWLLPPPPPVGGKAIPIDKPIIRPKLETPWIWLLTIILPLVATVAFVKLKKKKQ